MWADLHKIKVLSRVGCYEQGNELLGSMRGEIFD